MTTDYAKELAERRKADALVAKQRQEVAYAVLGLLGFTPEPPRDGADPLGTFDANVWERGHKEDMTLIVRTHDDRTKGARMTLRACYPDGKDSGDIYVNDLPTAAIEVSLTKKPEQIAAEVERRLMPVYMQGMQKARERVRAARAYHGSRAENLARVLGRKLTELESSSGACRLYDMTGDAWGDVNASDDSVRLDLHSVPVDIAVQIMQLLRRRKKGDR